MKQFKTLGELNRYINNNSNEFISINIENLTVQLTEPKRNFRVMSTTEKEMEYPCYIIFNDKESYKEYKIGRKLITDFSSINALQTNITLSKFRELKPSVSFIEFIDYEEKMTSTDVVIDGVFYKDNVNWGAEISNVQLTWNRGFTGKGVKVAVIDGYFVSEPNFIGFKEHIIFKEGLDKSPHGNQCASIIKSPLDNTNNVGIAYNCDLYALETGLYATYINQAYQWCIDNNMDIVSASYGVNSNTPSGGSTTTALLVSAMANAGIIFVAGAGNKNKYSFHSPASEEGAIAVGAINDIGRLVKVSWDDSNAEGGGMNQPWIDFIYSGQEVRVVGNNNNYMSFFSGTSAATPGIAALFALLKEEFPNKSREELIELMKENSFTVPTRYGKYPVCVDYSKQDVVDGRIAKVNKDGSINIKGEIRQNDSEERMKFDSEGNLYLTYNQVLATANTSIFNTKFKNKGISAKYIIENSKI